MGRGCGDEVAVKILVILQCAYGNTLHRRVELRDKTKWLEGLWVCYTGKRLREMLPEDCEVEVCNASLNIGSRATASFPPDTDHILAEIGQSKPDVILACGKIACEGMVGMGLDFVAAPPPAWRQLSKADISKIKAGLAGRC